MNIEFDDWALKQAIQTVADLHEKQISAFEATTLICTYLEMLDSRDRDFSDEMQEARKTFAKIPPDIAGVANVWAAKLPDVSRATVIALALMVDREQQASLERDRWRAMIEEINERDRPTAQQSGDR